MSEAVIQAPTPDDEGWIIFEDGRDRGDIGLISQLRIDATLRRLHIAAQELNPEMLGELSARAEEHLRIAIEQTEFTKDTDPLEYFHLKIKHALIQQIVMARHAFSRKGLYDERRSLVDGSYGSIAEVLEESIDKFDATSEKEIDQRSRLAGAINEMTALALLDYPEKPERLAIPSDVTSDLYHATDLELFTLPRSRDTMRVYHTQVKTRSTRNVKMPFGGILIRAVDMSNTTRADGITFPSSRAIVRDVNATETRRSASHLSAAIIRFEDRLKHAIQTADSQLDAFDTLPTEMKQAMVGSMGRLITQLVNDYPNDSVLNVSIYEADD